MGDGAAGSQARVPGAEEGRQAPQASTEEEGQAEAEVGSAGARVAGMGHGLFVCAQDSSPTSLPPRMNAAMTAPASSSVKPPLRSVRNMWCIAMAPACLSDTGSGGISGSSLTTRSLARRTGFLTDSNQTVTSR